MALLKVTDLSVSYGHIDALHHVSVEANEGEIVSIIGSNGAGKTTILRTISGLVKAKGGTIEFQGEPVPKQPHKIVQKGIVHVPEGRRTFSGLTIRDNLLVGGYLYKGKELEDRLEEQYKLFPILEERKNQFAGTLSGGEQQMLAIGRALMCKPKMLLLDEPSMGLSPLLVKEIFKIIRDVNRQGVTVLLVEQNAKMALDIANRAYVLETGTIKMEGDAHELANNIEVRKAYLGC